MLSSLLSELKEKKKQFPNLLIPKSHHEDPVA